MSIVQVRVLSFLLLTAACSSPSLKPADHSAFEKKEVSVPFILHDNRILIEAMVNGQGPYTFLFDTGGARSNTITPIVAKELGLELSPGPEAKGAGSGTQATFLTKVESYEVAGLIAKEQKMVVLDLSEIKKAFAFDKLDGVIGFEVLKKAVTCIDFEKRLLTFKAAGADCFTDQAKAIIPLRIHKDSPFIQGAVNGVKAEFFVDTGDRSAFSLFRKFAAKSGLENNFTETSVVISGYGVGGPIPAKLKVLREIELGSEVRLVNVLSRLPMTNSGFFAKSDLGGSIGNEVLRRFNLVLDYPKKELRLVKNSNFDDPFKFVPPAAN